MTKSIITKMLRQYIIRGGIHQNRDKVKFCSLGLVFFQKWVNPKLLGYNPSSIKKKKTKEINTFQNEFYFLFFNTRNLAKPTQSPLCGESIFIYLLHPVGLEPTSSFRSRIMSAMRSTTLPWMLLYFCLF